MCVLFQDVEVQAKNESASVCTQPALVQQGYRMGGPVSSLTYSLPLHVVLQPRSETSLTSIHTCKMHQQSGLAHTLKMVFFLCLLQPPLLSGCQDPISWRSSLLCCYQRRALSPCFVHVQGQDQALCRQTEGDLQPGEVQWWKVALGQWISPLSTLSITTSMKSLNQHQRMRLTTSLCLLSVGHIQFGEEEIQVGCGWDQSPGRSAD